MLSNIDYLRNSITFCATVRGEYDPEKEYFYGDIVTRGDSVWAYNGSKWEELDRLVSLGSVQEEVVYQCRNCGAPTNHDGYCLYCGTINRKFRN